MPAGARIPFQPALDGVRGVAVAAVLAYHGGVAWAGGGFLGVDVFLVLSGYLITAILVAEWLQLGRIDVRAFWAGRARRLLPALLAVFVVVAALAPHLMPSEELRTLRDDGVAAVFHLSNWRQVFAGESYFHQFGLPSPFLHLWSLSVEAQWYLLWPFVLIVGLRFVRRARSLLFFVIAAAVASAWLMAVLASSPGNLARPFYGTDTRAHALLVGAALALLLVPWSAAPRTRDSAAWLGAGVVRFVGLVGAAALAAMFVTADGESLSLYRGGSAVVALAAAALIAAAVQPAGLVRRALSVRPLRAAGRISYGLYLWHWPVYLALTPARTGLTGVPLLGVRVATTTAIAAVSYRFLEMPIRRGAIPFRNTVRTPLVAAAAMAGVVALLAVSTRGARPFLEPVSNLASVPAAAAPAATVAQAAADPDSPAPAPAPAMPATPDPDATPTTQPAPTPTASPPRRPAPDPDRLRVLLAGDSAAFSLGWHFKPEVVGGGAVRTAALIGCGVARGRPIGSPPGNGRCEQWPARWDEAAASFDQDVAVIMVGAWEVFDRQVGGQVLRVGTPEYERYLLEELETGFRLLAARGAPIALLNVPCFEQPHYEIGRQLSERNDPARVAWVNGVLTRFAALHADRLTLVDLSAFLCPGGEYVAALGGVKMRSDGVHFTPEGARATWRWLWPQLVDISAG